MGGDDDKVRTGLLPGKKQVYIVVSGDLVHQRILKDRKTVAKADDDVAPEVFSCFQKEAVGAFGGCSGGSSARMRLISLTLL